MDRAAARTVATPVGALALAAARPPAGEALVRIRWGRAEREAESALLDRAAAWLAAYFAGVRPGPDLPVAPAGTAHDRAVWRAMQAIPPGETRTYGEVARALGSCAQAVGQACRRNPLPIVIPCHRIVAAGGALGGYSGGAGPETKRYLLNLERAGMG